MAKLTRGELIALNKQLKLIGERICLDCVGRFSLASQDDNDAFYYRERQRSPAHGGHQIEWDTVCKRCRKLTQSLLQKQRRKTNEAFRLAAIARATAWKRDNREAARAINNRWARNEKRRKMARIMGKGEAA